MNSLYSVFPILFFIIMGYILGRFFPKIWLKYFGKSISLLVWLLLLSIGLGFGNIFKESNTAYRIFEVAVYYSLITTLVSSILVLGFYKFEQGKLRVKGGSYGVSIIAPLREASIALLMVLIGILLSLYFSNLFNIIEQYEVPKWLLYTLILFVGIDLVGLKIDKNSFSLKLLFVPILVVFGSILGGAIASLIFSHPLNIGIALSAGFGWFTLSSVLLSDKLGVEFGAIALLIDLFRELLAILLLYLFGHSIPKTAIAAAGATSLDSTLPIVKQTCPSSEIPLALISGLILTILAPILITFFLAM